MRVENKVKVALLVVSISCVLVRGAAAQGSSSQIMKLPPVPGREMDPEMRYQRDPAAAMAAQRELAARSERRRQIFFWATNELVVLSERVDKAASASAADASKAELTANVNKIEALAKNLAAAMKAQ